MTCRLQFLFFKIERNLKFYSADESVINRPTKYRKTALWILTVLDSSTGIRVVSASWYVNPYPLSELDAYKYGSNTLSLFLLDSTRNVITIGSKIMKIILPYKQQYSYYSNETWKSWDINFSNNSLTENFCTVNIQSTSNGLFSGCNLCRNESQAIITTSHLSSFVITLPTSNFISNQQINGVGKKYEEPIDAPTVIKSYGALFVCGLVVLFCSGLLITWLLDLKSHKLHQKVERTRVHNDSQFQSEAPFKRN